MTAADAHPASGVDLAAIREAASRIAPWVHRTPLLENRSLDALLGCRLQLKAEHLQKVGAHLSKMNRKQSDYIGVPVEGPFKPDHYRY